MFKITIALCLSLLCTVASAALPPAPLNVSTGQEIVNTFKDYYEDDFRNDMARVPKSAFPTTEQSFVYAKYMSKAFAKAGYSLDDTLFSYFKSERTPSVVLFMSKLNLETYAIFLKSDSVASAFLKAGATSERTIAYAKDLAREIPISTADYIIEGNSERGVSGAPTAPIIKERLIGYVREGKGRWNGWIYFQSFSLPGESHGIGLTAISEASHDEMEIWKSLIDKKTKVEGSYINYKGVSITTNDGKYTINDPVIFDRARAILLKTL